MQDDRVQIKSLKNFRAMPLTTQKNIKKQLQNVKCLQRHFVAEKDPQVFQFCEQIVANQGSLFLSSEPVHASLLELLQGKESLIEQNSQNEMVSLTLLQSILSILH